MLLGLSLYILELIEGFLSLLAVLASILVGLLEELFVLLQLNTVHSDLLESCVPFLLHLLCKVIDLR